MLNFTDILFIILRIKKELEDFGDGHTYSLQALQLKTLKKCRVKFLTR